MNDHTMITNPDTFFVEGCGRCDRFRTADCRALFWQDGLLELRRICRDAGLKEKAKWGHPCYMHANRNIAIIGAFRDDFRLTFFHAALLKDPDGILQKQGPNTQTAGMVRFATAAEVKTQEPSIRAYLEEAMRYAEAGILPAKTTQELLLPDTLVEAMDADPEMAEAFHALTPGRQRGWTLHLNSTKNPQTQRNRITRMRDKVIAGKGWNER